MELGRGQRGAFTIQLILDNGADEYVLRPSADDAATPLTLFERGGGAAFDLEREVLMFGNLSSSGGAHLASPPADRPARRRSRRVRAAGETERADGYATSLEELALPPRQRLLGDRGIVLVRL